MIVKGFCKEGSIAAFGEVATRGVEAFASGIETESTLPPLRKYPRSDRYSVRR